jgi:hypothetical protein
MKPVFEKLRSLEIDPDLECRVPGPSYATGKERTDRITGRARGTNQK